MELPDIINTQYGFHCLIVGSVVFCAILVFVFGFKSAEEPPFDKLTYGNDERKPAGKKRKLKDKKAQSNGHATAVIDVKKTDQKPSTKKDVEKSPSKDSAKNKEEKKSQALREAKENKTNRKAENVSKSKGKGKENVEVKNKKNQGEEKPKDFDDGEWEQALSRKDKMKRKAALEEILPQKTDKKKEDKKKKSGDDAGDSQKEALESDDGKPKEISPVMEALAEIGLATEVEAKPSPKVEPAKKVKKKKAAELAHEEKEEPVAAQPTPEPEPKAQRAPKKQEKEKQEPPPSPPAAKTEANDVPVSESNVAFDELGDTWKEAKAPKKAAKKKSRKE